jgi:hypothetical protein
LILDSGSGLRPSGMTIIICNAIEYSNKFCGLLNLSPRTPSADGVPQF